MSVKPMPVLLIEDDVGVCVNFKDCANRRSDISFVGMTDSCEEGIKLVKAHLPEGVILDLQLVKGYGSGFQFLEMLNKTELAFRPIVVVTTSNQSQIVYNLIENLGADWFFSKSQRGYSEDFVIDTLLTLRKSLHTIQQGGASDRQAVESPEERKNRIYSRIDAELNLIGIKLSLKGWAYLREAIYIQLNKEKGGCSAIDQVAINNRHTYTSTCKVMQTAINNAWDNMSIEDLQRHYTARVSVKTGVPSPSEFIWYYANKICKTI